MALSTNIKFKGVALPSAYIRVDRVFGGKKEGWNSVVGVYASSESAETESPLETFNQPTAYVAEENPLALIYTALKEKYPEVVDC